MALCSIFTCQDKNISKALFGRRGKGRIYNKLSLDLKFLKQKERVWEFKKKSSSTALFWCFFYSLVFESLPFFPNMVSDYPPFPSLPSTTPPQSLSSYCFLSSKVQTQPNGLFGRRFRRNEKEGALFGSLFKTRERVSGVYKVFQKPALLIF
jgi:hypothetical protein